ncbi:hypothetical protein [Alloactinosynnema sp. L-07]|nr:hypothetical protein [Alloactinosynnema sp. L-07]
MAAMFSDAEIVALEHTAMGETWLAAEVKRADGVRSPGR